MKNTFLLLFILLLVGCGPEPVMLVIPSETESHISKPTDYRVTTDGNGHFSVIRPDCGWKCDTTFSNCDDAIRRIDVQVAMSFELDAQMKIRHQIGWKVDTNIIFVNGQWQCRK